MKIETEGVVRTYLETEVPKIDRKSMWKQVRRFGNDGYFFPIKGVKPLVHDIIADAADTGITGPFVLGKHMDLYDAEHQEKRLFDKASKVITTLLQHRENDGSLEYTYSTVVGTIQDAIRQSSEKDKTEMGAIEFAYRFGEAVAYTHLTKKHYDAEFTYLPSQDELDLLPTELSQLTKIAGLYVAWEAKNCIDRTTHTNPNPFSPLIKMRAWGAYNFHFIDNDFYYDIEGVTGNSDHNH